MLETHIFIGDIDTVLYSDLNISIHTPSDASSKTAQIHIIALYMSPRNNKVRLTSKVEKMGK